MFTDKELQEIKSNTEINYHTANFLLIAEKLDLDNLAIIFKAITVIISFEKSTPSEIFDYRYDKYLDMMTIAKTKLDDTMFSRLMDSLQG